MTPEELLLSTRDHLDASDSFWTGVQMWRRLDDAQREITRLIVKERNSFFVASTTITLVSDQAEYSLPLNARLGTRIIIMGDGTTTSPGAMGVGDIREMFDYGTGAVINLTHDLQFLLVNGKVRVLPTPKSAGRVLTIYYNPSFGNMMQGTASAGGASTLTAWSGDPNYSTNYGWVDTRDDYYNAMELRLLSGSGGGQYRTISDYVGSTRQFTVDTAWDTQPDTDTVFAVMCPVPEDHHDVVSVNAARRASIKGRTRFKDLDKLYNGHPGQSGLLKELLFWVGQRQATMHDTVDPLDYGD